MVDLAEQKLWESIQHGEPWGITLCLKTLGKDRGYVERQEVSGQAGTPLTLKVVYEDALDVTSGHAVRLLLPPEGKFRGSLMFAPTSVPTVRLKRHPH